MSKFFATLFLAMTTTFSHAEGAFTLHSDDFSANQYIPIKHAFNAMGCIGQNLSPALKWQNAPAGTKSFAILVHDPDAPTGGSGWWHWLVLNIPATVNNLPQGATSASLPVGAVEVTTDFGSKGYGGPCPPVGDAPHHYNFTIYALKVDKLDVSPNVAAATAGFMVNANALAHATLMGLFARPKK